MPTPSLPSPDHPLRGCISTRSPLAASLLLALLTVAPSLAAQQSVRGTVLDGVTETPVEGAMVVLLQGEAARSRVLTAADGTFRLSVPSPGRYLLRVDRIGYESTSSEAFDVTEGATVEKTVLSRVRPVTLAGLDVEAERRCEVRPDEGLATGRVWEEARKALDAAAWTSERDLYRFTWMRYVRSVDPGGRRVLDEDRTYQSRFTPQPFVSLDAEVLAREGYIHRTEDNARIFYAPDARVLLSDSFLDTHCFGLERRVEGEERLIGLRFQPIPGHDLPDVRGVLWIAEQGARLRSVAYDYVDPRQRIRREEGGGELTFRGLPNGTWIVQEWRIRMPELVEIRGEYGEVRSYRVEGYRDEGGVVSRVARRDGGVVETEERLATLSGEVRDSLGRPAAGARVWVEGGGLEATTDPEGTFTLTGVLPGTWSVGASEPSLERVGHTGTFQEVVLEAGERAHVLLSLPSRRDFGLARCRDARTEETAILMGRVVDEEGRPAPGAEVSVLWSRSEAAATAVRRRPVRGRDTPTVDVLTRQTEEGLATTADARGVFILCALPRVAEVRTRASLGQASSQETDIDLTQASDVYAVELVISPGPPNRR